MSYEGRLDEVRDELAKIISSLPRHDKDLILGSMTTIPHPLAREIYEAFHDLNANDEKLFGEVRRLEREVVSMLGSLFSCSGCDGMITTGGTESNMAALYLAREHGYDVVYASRTAHYSIGKSAKVLRMKYVEVPHKDFRVDVKALRETCRSYGRGVVVATVGTTGVGTIDPVEEINEVAEDCDLVIHVDAAYGGLVAPFVYDKRRLGFENSRVVTITLDPHKLGQVPLQAGGLIARNSEWLEPLYFEASYLPAGRQLGLLGTRSAGPVAAAWAMLRYWGLEGYREQALELMRRLNVLRDLLTSVGARLVVEPEVPIACVSDESPEKTLQDLWRRGIYVYTCGVAKGIRVVIMPHVTEPKLRTFVKALAELRGLRSEAL